jgi:hypothetical protein
MCEPPYWGCLTPGSTPRTSVRASVRAWSCLLPTRHASDDGTVRGGTWLETKERPLGTASRAPPVELERLTFLEVIRAPKMANLYKLSLTPPTGGVLGTAPNRCSEVVAAGDPPGDPSVPGAVNQWARDAAARACAVAVCWPTLTLAASAWRRSPPRARPLADR